MDAVNGIGAAALAAVSGAVAAPAARVDEATAAGFAAMVAPEAQAEAAATHAPGPSSGSATPGDAILDGMRSIGSQFSTHWDAMKAAVDQSAQTMSVADMLRVQMQLIQLSVQVELVGKAIGRTSQNIDQLVKLQ